MPMIVLWTASVLAGCLLTWTVLFLFFAWQEGRALAIRRAAPARVAQRPRPLGLPTQLVVTFYVVFVLACIVGGFFSAP